MTNVVESVALSEDGASEHVQAVDEYYRKNFRKLSTEDAIHTLTGLAKLTKDGKRVRAESLDGSFWFWETVETAIIGKVDEMSESDFEQVFVSMMINAKGSQDLLE